jgi:hypothetical protein
MYKTQFIVSVRCFTFNQSKYIEETLDGFVMQKTSFPFICIIMDDDSQDGEPEVIKHYLEHHFNLADDSVVRNEETDDYIMTFAQHKENKNCYFAVYYLKYNHYKKKAKEPYFSCWEKDVKYIALCEGDDCWIDAKKLQKQVDYMEQHIECSLTHTAFEYMDEDVLQKNSIQDINKKNLSLLESECDLRPYILDGNQYLIQTMTVLFRREDFMLYKSFIKDYEGKFLMGDTQLWVYLLSKGSLFYFSDITSIYRLHQNSATHQSSIEAKLRFSLSCTEMRVYMSEKCNLSSQYITKFVNQYKWTLIEYLWYNKDYQPVINVTFTWYEELILMISKQSFVRSLGRLIYESKIKDCIANFLRNMSPFK